jgi:hypothetical protein
VLEIRKWYDFCAIIWAEGSRLTGSLYPETFYSSRKKKSKGTNKGAGLTVNPRNIRLHLALKTAGKLILMPVEV